VASEVTDEASRALHGLTWQKGVTALVVMVAFFVGARIASRVVRRSLSPGRDWSGPVFALSKLLGYLVVFVGFVTALGVLHVPLSSLLVISSALLVGIGFALQHIAQDFIAGIILLIEQPIRKNDYVTFGETAGTVQEIGLRATHLHTVDGTDVVVPNHLLVTREVANHSHPIPRARLTVDVPVSLTEDVDPVKQALASVAESHPLVLDQPEPMVRLDAIRESSFQFTLVVWIRDPPTMKRIASELRCAIAHAFAAAGVRFPTPELLLHTSLRPSREENAGSQPEPPL